MSHTPEPWIVNGSIRIESDHEHGFVNDGWIIGDLDGPDAKENARRIVACVNACAGIDTSIIEQNDNKVSDLLTQRDELLAALKLVNDEKSPSYHDCTDNGEIECAWCISRALIKKLEPQS